MFKGIKVVDCHVHYSVQAGTSGLASFLNETGTDMANIVAVPHSRCVSLNPGALVMKHSYPGRFYVFGSLDASAYFLTTGGFGEHMTAYAKRMAVQGCDGVKLLEGKPQLRKSMPVPDFDHSCWEPLWAYLEETHTPILMHLNDPENFWTADVPAMAKAHGWFYDDSYVNNEAQYDQMLRVLSRHPKLKIIFAHFFFMSAQLHRLSAILDAYPGVMVDLTPGIEMYENFSANINEAAAFFKKYQKRIIYGTDIGGRCNLAGEDKPFNRRENLRRPEIVRRFLSEDGEETVSSDGDYLIDRADFTLRGLGLEKAALTRLLGENFLDFVGPMRAVEPEAVLEECGSLRRACAAMASKYPAFHPDHSCIELAENYFG